MVNDIEGKKSKIAKYFSKIVSGFFIGVGFSIAIIVVFASFEYTGLFDKDETETQQEEAEPPSFESYMSSRIEFDENSGLVIQKHEPKKYENKLIILGQIKNTGQENWERIHIQVELFDSKKVFVDQCSGLIWGILKVNQTRNFKITCGECDNGPLIEFSSYDIKILDASHKEVN